MPKSITHDVLVSVETAFEDIQPSHDGLLHLFSYAVRIENRSDTTIQLLRRKWIITDAAHGKRLVEGEGVVGEQPILEPGAFHEYSSGCRLLSDFGRMEGWYYFARQGQSDLLQVVIPPFQLVSPYRMN